MAPSQLRGSTWASDLQAYEREKRGPLPYESKPPVYMAPSLMARKARAFDPLLQRFTDDGRERNQQTLENEVRMHHLNRAADVQIRREGSRNIVNHVDRLHPIAPDNLFIPVRNPDPNLCCIHHTTAEHNIISNLPMDVHHWGDPDTRPQPTDRDPRPRMIPSHLVRDFDIVTNRYNDDHEEKTFRDQVCNLQECTGKYRQTCVFDPVTSEFNDKREESRARAADHAREVEIHLRAQAKIPTSYQGRETEFYDPVTHKVHNRGMLDLYDDVQDNRKSRYKTRCSFERSAREKDIAFENTAAAQNHEQISHERHDETTRRGYDVLTNQLLGSGPHEKRIHLPSTMPKLTAWDKVVTDRLEGSLPPSARSEVSHSDLRREPWRASSLSATPRTITPRRLAEAGANSVSSASGRTPRGYLPASSSVVNAARAS